MLKPSFLKLNECLVEPIMNDLHCLLHADDTLLLSTNRESFVYKCNILLKQIAEKKMKLNYSKSAYMIINGKKNDGKSNLKLNSAWLQYKSVNKYLGAIFWTIFWLWNTQNGRDLLHRKEKERN